MTTQRLEEWLEAAAHQAAQDRALDGHLADSRRPLDLPGRRVAAKLTSTRWVRSSSTMLVSMGGAGAATSMGFVTG